ncbi:hypothetical protein [Kineococcus sp. SYSU DK003]|uniref:hypothetical protein n=1 Tax=Kineococcus sp. SYSU DK003 TaxID=3383124 RepID=UPI003D7D7687
MSQDMTLTVTKVIHDDPQGLRHLEIAAAMEGDLRAQANKRGMVVDSISDALVQPALTGPGG